MKIKLKKKRSADTINITMQLTNKDGINISSLKIKYREIPLNLNKGYEFKKTYELATTDLLR